MSHNTVKRQSESSRRKIKTWGKASRTTRQQSSPAMISVVIKASDSAAGRCSASASSLLSIGGSAGEIVGPPNLLLQQQYAVEQRLSCRLATRYVDVNRHDPVAAANDGVRIMKIDAALGAGDYRDYSPW